MALEALNATATQITSPESAEAALEPIKALTAKYQRMRHDVRLKLKDAMERRKKQQLNAMENDVATDLDRSLAEADSALQGKPELLSQRRKNLERAARLRRDQRVALIESGLQVQEQAVLSQLLQGIQDRESADLAQLSQRALEHLAEMSTSDEAAKLVQDHAAREKSMQAKFATTCQTQDAALRQRLQGLRKQQAQHLVEKHSLLYARMVKSFAAEVSRRGLMGFFINCCGCGCAPRSEPRAGSKIA
jgi:hypothetical protein